MTTTRTVDWDEALRRHAEHSTWGLTGYTAETEALLGLLHTHTEECEPCEALVAAGDSPAQVSPSGSGAGNSVASVAWAGVIGVEGEMTGDGRLIETNALRWENLPLPLRYVPVDTGGHDGAMVVGQITSITRNSSGAIEATGTFDSDSLAGQEAIRQVGEGLTTGVSMDLDDVSFEVRIAQDLIDADPMLGLMLGIMPSEDEEPAPEGDQPEEPAVDSDGRVTVMEIGADDEVRVTTDGRIRAATIVAIPAFATATIHLVDETAPAEGEQVPPEEEPGETEVPTVESTLSVEALIASAIPLAPPAAWFSDPGLREVTPMTVTDAGRIYGHLAAWNTCHIAHSHRGCVTPPHTRTGYAYFRTGSILTAEGAEIAVGHVTLDTRHAAPSMRASQAAAHYEDTGAVVADVTAGEDAHGIWVAGALRPGTTPEQVRALRSAPLSGDWRGIAGNLELVAALAVNVPGFPIPRPSGLVAGGAVRSLVASGMVAPRRVRRPGTPGALSLDDLRYLKRLADRERAEEQRLALGDLASHEETAARVRAYALKRRRDKATATT